jgi:cytoskeleton protein RodZ
VNELFKTLGEELSRQRQEKELTIGQLSAKTKITEGFLEKMEQGDFTFLPAVYVRAFLRTVSNEIGLDPEVMVRRFADEAARLAQAAGNHSGGSPQPGVERPAPAPAHTAEPAEAKPERKSEATDADWFKSPFTLGVMLIIVLASLYLAFSRKPHEEPEALDTGISVQAPAPESKALRDAPLIPITGENKVDSTAVTRLTLNLKSEETAWVRIVYQDSLVEEGVFTEGLSRSWMSAEKFYLKIGNAGGIRLALDGRDLGLTGEKGQVVTIVVTKEGIAAIDPSQAPALLTQVRP